MAINKQYSYLLECLPAVQEFLYSNPGQDMSVLGPQVDDGVVLG
jgi:hypothetical protein